MGPPAHKYYYPHVLATDYVSKSSLSYRQHDLFSKITEPILTSYKVSLKVKREEGKK